MKTRFADKTSWIFIGVLLFFTILILSPSPVHQIVYNTDLDILFKLRDDRQPCDKIVVLFLGPEDIRALNGWPITRDYYGYVTHLLNQTNAKVIGFDLLFDTRDARYPEFDQSLANFFQAARNICLPMAFSGLELESNRIPTGISPVFPIPELATQAAGIGFSNLADETVIRSTPLVVQSGDSVLLSFGAELARIYLGGKHNSIKLGERSLQFSDDKGETYIFPIDKRGYLQLNHFGPPDIIEAISFVNLLQIFRTTPDSLDFSDKIVLIAVTSPGIAKQVSTPLSPAFPASFIHATAAENLIAGNYLKTVQSSGEIGLLFLLLFFLWVIHRYQSRQIVSYSSAGILLFYWLCAFFLFKFENYILPLLYPTVSYFALWFSFEVVRFRRQRRREIFRRNMLAEQISAKQNQLQEAEENLMEIRAQMEEERQKQAALSTEIKQDLQAKRQEIFRLENELHDLQKFATAEVALSPHYFPEIIHGENSKMVAVLQLIDKIGSDTIPVFILGETGTGKELIARAIHQSGKRRYKPFIAVNCGALPETLLESELFGHEKGSFTGAASQRKGRFELAHGGTLFLDEITETTPAFQSKLLRVLQEGTFERLGGEKTIRVDVRIIASSSKNLRSEMEAGTFRDDLFYRLSGFPVSLPPLRERQNDLPLLAQYFLRKHGYRSVTGFSHGAMAILKNYAWPGNVRELENMVRRAAILAQSENRRLIRSRDLPEEITVQSGGLERIPYLPLEDQILQMLRTLKFSHSAISQTAKALGNRDRGTITEYFRGICFARLVEADFDKTEAAKRIANSSEEEILRRVKSKIGQYLKNIKIRPGEKDLDLNSAPFKGLPQKYHIFLKQVIRHYFN